MNEIKIIEQREVLGKEFKIYGDIERPLFLAKDVAEWIDYAYKDSRKINRDVSKMLQSIDDEEKEKHTLKLGGEDCSIRDDNNTTTQNSHGGIRENTNFWFLTEDGLYELLMQSRKPIAKQFKKKVKEILKEIRKTGSYIVDNDNARITAVEKSIVNIDDPAILDLIINLANKTKLLQQENTILQPKAEYYDELVDRNLLLSLRDSAKELKIKEREFIKCLLDDKYLYRDKKKRLKPYAHYVPTFFEIKEYVYGEHTGNQTLITPKGREHFNRIYKK